MSSTHVFPGFDPGTTRGDAALLILASPTTAPRDSAGGGRGRRPLRGRSARAPGRLGPDQRQRPLRPGRPPLDLQRGPEPDRLQDADPALLPALLPRPADVHGRPSRPKNGGCFGDSGGPAIAQRADGSPVEIGIVSTGGPTAAPSSPTSSPAPTRSPPGPRNGSPRPNSAPRRPRLKAKLPAMSRESAEGLVRRAAQRQVRRALHRQPGPAGRLPPARAGAAEVRTALALRAEDLLRHRHRLLRAAAGHRRLGQQLRGQPGQRPLPAERPQRALPGRNPTRVTAQPSQVASPAVTSGFYRAGQRRRDGDSDRRGDGADEGRRPLPRRRRLRGDPALRRQALRAGRPPRPARPLRRRDRARVRPPGAGGRDRGAARRRPARSTGSCG